MTCGLAWRVVSGDDAGSPGNFLYSVAVLSTNDVWGVGQSDPNYSRIEHWDGEQWTLVPSPSPGSRLNSLTDVAAISANDIWAVGHTDDPTPRELTLIEHWDGTLWSVIPSPNMALTTTNVLWAVSAVSIGDVWAVGYFIEAQGTIGYARPLIMHWDGQLWSIVPGPSSSPLGSRTSGSELYGELLDVAVLSASNVWAVGYFYGAVTKPLVLHWDGTTWYQVSAPNPLAGSAALYGVSVVSDSDIWAVGGNEGKTFTAHWDGIEWTVVPSPSIGTDTINLLNEVTAISANNVWAAGYYCCPGHGTLVEHWNGMIWSIVPSPSPGTAYNVLFGISAVLKRPSSSNPSSSASSSGALLAPNEVWAVGEYWNGSGSHFRTLIERYSDPCITPSPTTTGTPPTFTPTLRPTQTYTLPSTGTSSPTVTPSPTITHTPSATHTLTPGVTTTPGTPSPSPSTSPTPTPRPNTTSTACPMTFADVSPSDYFYQPVLYLYCRGVISGYADNTFRPYNNTTRGQLTKIVALGFGLPVYNPTAPTFNDVPATDPFYGYIETAYHAGLVSGYSCGGQGEPCPGLYFRPGSLVTRGQLCKLVVVAAGWPLLDPSAVTFQDVPVVSSLAR